MRLLTGATLAVAIVMVSARWSMGAESRSLPLCVTIPVEALDKLDSGKTRIGDRFRFRAIDTVLTTDGTRIPRGTVGYGLAQYVSAAGAHAKPGVLILEARYFALPHGKHYDVAVDATASSEIHSGSSRNAPGIMGAVPVPFMGVALGAFNYFHAGSNVTVPVGYRFAVTPVGDLGKTARCTPDLTL